MSRDEEAMLAGAWLRWRERAGVGDTVANSTYIEFIARVVRRDRRFRDVHVFEVLDVLVNAESHTLQTEARRA